MYTVQSLCVQQATCAVARVVHAYIPRSCRSHKICIFMFSRISGEKNNSSNDAVPDPSFFVKGLRWLARLSLYRVRIAVTTISLFRFLFPVSVSVSSVYSCSNVLCTVLWLLTSWDTCPYPELILVTEWTIT